MDLGEQLVRLARGTAAGIVNRNALGRKDKRRAIFFHDKPVLYLQILNWDPNTAPPHFLKLRLTWLIQDHEAGLNQTPLDVFYRIFLKRQLDPDQQNRPRFLTAERRARINMRRIARKLEQMLI